MQTSLSKRVIGCIGKCTSGLNPEELDQITDNISKTLAHPKGRKIFKKYLVQRDLRDDLECLVLYETCCEFVDQENHCSLEPLIDNVTRVKEMVEDLDGVTEIDMALLQSFNQALNSNSRTDLLGVLVKTRDRSRDHLKSAHEAFKKYASEPCPMTK